ncbi:MAG: cupin domain-containing protein [Alphaproteobacteria bacterium]|nr:cupin domain-containing protein [Alphaproteobacteria bacterium]
MLGSFNKRSSETTRYSADDVVAMLGLVPHPEGGYYREMFRDEKKNDAGRSASTSIYYLLTQGQTLHWHRVDAAEVWHWYGGAALVLETFNGKELTKFRVSGNLMEGERPQLVIPAKCWQTASTTGEWTLVGCTVAPGFESAGCEMAPPGWQPSAQ